MLSLTPADYDAIFLSAKVAVSATIFSLPVGFAVAYLMTYLKFRGKVLFEVIITLPLTLPPVVIGYFLLILLGKKGALGPLLESVGIRLIFTWKAAVVASAVVGFPLLVRSIRIGMESIDPTNLKDVNKGFNKPGEYAAVLERLALRNVYAITSFIFGMDNDTVGVAERTLQQVRTWPPGLPIFGLLTPLPATPLYKRLEAAGRLTRPRHWKGFVPFTMAHTPLRMSIEEAHNEIRYGWDHSYSPQALARAVDSLDDQPLGYRINIFLARLCFRGIYFPMMDKLAWVKVIAQNWRTILRLTKEAVFRRRPEVREIMSVPISLETPLGEEGAPQPSNLIS